MRKEDKSAWSKVMRFFSTNEYLEKIGAKVESMTVPPLSETKGEIFECNQTTDNLKFEVKCIGIANRLKEAKMNPSEKAEKSTIIHVEVSEFNDPYYRAKIEWNTSHNNGLISIWVNKQNSLFNILSLLVKCQDRIQRDWVLHACSVSTFEANLPWLIEVMEKSKLPAGQNKYEDMALLALLFSINKMNADEYTRWFYRLIYSIWLFSSICFNHISDELAVIALAECRDIIGIKFIFKNTYYEKKNVFDLINESRSKESNDKHSLKKKSTFFDEEKVFALEGWKISEP